MCQLIIKDFELSFGKITSLDQDNTPERRRRQNYYGDEYSNPEESPVPDEAQDVKPFAKKSKDKVLFV